jgi:PAS domain-containing protein
MVTQPLSDGNFPLRLLDQAPGFIIIMRGPGHVVEFVNKTHQIVFNSGGWVGRPIREAAPDLEGQGFFERLDDVFRSGETFRAENMPARHGVGPTDPGQTRYLTFVYAPLRDDEGHIDGVFCEGLDVTEAHLREARFREELEAAVAKRTAAITQSEKTIRTIFETSYMNQGLLTTDGKIVYVNATSLASIKSRLEDVVGKDFADTPWFTGTPGMPDQVREGIARVAAGESIQISMPLNMPTGHRIYEFSMRPAMDEAGVSSCCANGCPMRPRFAVSSTARWRERRVGRR